MNYEYSDESQAGDYADDVSEEDTGVLFEVEGEQESEEGGGKYFNDSMENVIDSNGHYQYHKPTPIESYPARSDVFEALSKLHAAFSKNKGFEVPEVEEGANFYFVSKDYVRKLCIWLNEEDEAKTEESLEVNNEIFFDPKSFRIRARTIQGNTAVVSEDVWGQLIDWFGGGHSVKLRCIKGKLRIGQAIELRVVYDKVEGKFRRFIFSSLEKVDYAKLEICKTFGIEIPDDVRMHDIYKGVPYNRLDGLTNLKRALDEMQLIGDNIIFLESEGPDGKYKIKYNKYGRMTTQQIDSISGQPSPIGVVGLENLGNTCYMNSIMQCLSNISLLKEAFLSEAFKNDINMDNVLGYKGKVAKGYFKVVSCMWSGKGNVVRPSGFRKVITKAKPDFEGYEQHDSQEFLSQLLDALHEDLNRIIKKPITEKVEANGRPDVEVADESLATYKARNDSIVADLFTGLYKSTVTCPIDTCGNVSVTFDPYMIIPLPLQTGEVFYHVLQVLYVPRNPAESPRRVNVIVPKHGPVYLLKEILKEELGINHKNQMHKNLLANGKEKEIEPKELILQSQVYADNNPEVIGNIDLLLFRSSYGKLSPVFYYNLDSLSRMTESTPLVAYESFKSLQFEYFIDEPYMHDWTRKLDGPRFKVQRSRKPPKPQGFGEVLEEDEAEAEIDPFEAMFAEVKPGSDAERVIGIVNCPFLIDDTWYGSYNFNESDQLLRLEVREVARMNWSEYANYKEEVIAYNGDLGHADTQITEEEFAKYDVFQVCCFADSRTKPFRTYTMATSNAQTSFELLGVYFCQKPVSKESNSGKKVKSTDKVKTKKSGKSIFGFGSKRGQKKDIKKTSSKDKPSTTKEKGQETVEKGEPLHKIAKTMEKGILEQEFFHGQYVLRPTNKVKKWGSNTRGYNAAYFTDEDIREPIVLTGQVEKNLRFSWGKFQVHQGFVKGEFKLARYESTNWNNHLLSIPKSVKSSDIKNVTEFAVPNNRDSRLLVLVCHRLSTKYSGVPDAFYLPANVTESQATQVFRSRYDLYLQAEFEAAGEPRKGVDKEGNEFDKIDSILDELKFIRTDSEFRTQKPRKTRNHRRNSLGVGLWLDESSESSLQVGNEYIVWLGAYWEETYPFERKRGNELFIPKITNQERMTLAKAIDLFQQTDKLSKMNAWYCNQCKEHREAFKQLQLWSLPKVLVIQFKRFSQDEGRSTADKLEIPVEFPFDLDLKDVTLSSKIEEQAGESVNADVRRADEALSSYEYELVAVSSHVGGGLGFGHYIACAKNEETGLWYEFDDSRVTEIGEKDFSMIVNPQAYVLFYVNKRALAERQVLLEARREQKRKEAEEDIPPPPAA